MTLIKMKHKKTGAVIYKEASIDYGMDHCLFEQLRSLGFETVGDNTMENLLNDLKMINEYQTKVIFEQKEAICSLGKCLSKSLLKERV